MMLAKLLSRGHYALLPLILVPLAMHQLRPPPYPTVALPDLHCEDSDAGVLLIIIDHRSRSTYTTDPQRRREHELAQTVAWFDRADCHPQDSAAAPDLRQRDSSSAPSPA